jgi:hypothetical protein
MPRRNRPKGKRAGGPAPLRPDVLGGVTPAGAGVEGWTVRMSQKGGSDCPYCNRPIPAGKPHIVAWPEDEIELRRHWHVACWERELRRGGPTL